MSGTTLTSEEKRARPIRFMWSGITGDWVTVDTEAEAKAAAQADYEQRIRSALEAETGGGEHPDDLAVDRFATAMKAKLKWEREERNRSGWQDMTAADLSRLLYEHLPKGDPIDVANLVMMLHQNGQQIEAPATTTDERAVEALLKVQEFAQKQCDATLSDGSIGTGFRRAMLDVVAFCDGAALAAKPAVKDDETVVALLDERQKRAEQVHDRILAARDGIRVNLSPDSPEWLRDAFNKLHEAHHIMGGDPFDMHMRAALAAKDGRS